MLQPQARPKRGEIDLLLADLGYRLSPEQATPLYDTTSDVVLMAGGAGGGKSFVASVFATTRLMYSPLIWIVGPTYELARPEFLEIYGNLTNLDVIDASKTSIPQTGRCRMLTTFGQVIETQTADDVRKLAGRGPNGIIMAEAAQQPFDSFLRCMERLARAEDRRYAPWCFLSGTFEENRRWFADLYTALGGDNVWNGRSYSVPSWCNPHLYPLGRDDPVMRARERQFPADRFAERFAAVPVPPATLIFKNFTHARHVKADCQYWDDWPVQLWIDPGYSGSHYAVEVVQLPEFKDDGARKPLGSSEKQEVWVVDEVFGELAIAHEIIEICKAREWWDNVEGGVIDIAGLAHAAMPSQVEIWASEAKVGLRSNAVRVQEGIDRHQTFLKDPQAGEPRIFYNPSCSGILNEYGSWKRKTLTLDKVTINKPETIHCDGLKAVSYGLYDEFGPVHRVKPQKAKRRKYPWKTK